MRLSQVMPGATGPADPEIAALAFDARRVVPGALFFCVPGFTADGHDFAPAALAAGAAALVVERPLGLGVPEVRVPSARAAMAPAAARFHGDPTSRLDVVGITGTNGKTTSAFLVRGLLEAAGRPCGLLGTIRSVVGGEERAVERTTAEAIDLQAAFADMADAGDAACAMEVSSHALALHRADAIRWRVAVWTNLSQDHLDFHPDLESYFAAKKRLFAAGPRTSVVNVDDAHGRSLARELPGLVTVALDRPADWRGEEVESFPGGARIRARTPAGAVELVSPLPGRFNALNALGAAAAVHALGVGVDEIAAALPTLDAVPGRFEPVDAGQPFSVIVDYAHTPDGLENVLRAARELGAGRLTCVFGCGGDRDRAKRPLMGAVAAREADRVLVTSDNPRSEDPEAIVAAVLAGAGPGAEAVLDRRAAIARALGEAEAGDVVVIAGKGHEQGQELADGVVVPFDDVRVARDVLGAAVAR